MPIPTPKKGEDQKKFISRCMGDSVMNEDYKDNKQRAAVCYSQWRESKKADLLDFLQKEITAGTYGLQNQPVLDSEGEKPKASKAVANYVNHPVNDRTCSECTMFRAPGSCTAVEGSISPNGHCKYWEEKSGKADLTAFFAGK